MLGSQERRAIPGCEFIDREMHPDRLKNSGLLVLVIEASYLGEEAPLGNSTNLMREYDRVETKSCCSSAKKYFVWV